MDVFSIIPQLLRSSSSLIKMKSNSAVNLLELPPTAKPPLERDISEDGAVILVPPIILA